jgi:predicted nuclease of predicted toxin-antitoxin system
VKYVCDANLSPKVAQALRDAGFDTSHVGDHDLLTASDAVIFAWAIETSTTVITADSDFAMLLAVRQSTSPSVVLLRDIADQPPPVHARLLIENLPSVEEALATGAIISLSPSRLRVRELPIK